MTTQIYGNSELLKKLLESNQVGQLRLLVNNGPKPFTHEEAEHNFWARADYSQPGCWNWKGCKVKNGNLIQARCRLVGEQIASRVAWVLVHGPIPDGLNVLHTCDNESCIRPDHLWIGTYDDNNKDKARKGRSYRPLGALNPNVVLDVEKVKQIRSLRMSGMSVSDLCLQFGCSNSGMRSVLSGQTWSYVT